VDDDIVNIFEPGATPPTQRLTTLKTIASAGLLTGVSMMPMIPFISDTSEHLEKMYSAFKTHGAKYVMPATISLFGNQNSDSKTLVLRAVEKHYPHLHDKYVKWFTNSGTLPSYYRSAFETKMKELSSRYQLPNRIIQSL
jgi:DNA repair photolyase